MLLYGRFDISKMKIKYIVYVYVIFNKNIDYRIRANAHNSGNYETRDNARRTARLVQPPLVPEVWLAQRDAQRGYNLFPCDGLVEVPNF